jgi:hypothetical protein
VTPAPGAGDDNVWADAAVDDKATAARMPDARATPRFRPPEYLDRASFKMATVPSIAS